MQRSVKREVTQTKWCVIGDELDGFWSYPSILDGDFNEIIIGCSMFVISTEEIY